MWDCPIFLYCGTILVSQYFCGEIVENVIYYKKTEEVIRMEAVQTVRKSDERYTLEDAVNVLFSKLDSAGKQNGKWKKSLKQYNQYQWNQQQICQFSFMLFHAFSPVWFETLLRYV